MTETDSAYSTAQAILDNAVKAARPRNTFRFVAARITASHRELIERLQRIPPNEVDPRYQADAEELEHRAEVLRCHLLAVKDYVSEYLHDTAALSWSVNVERKYVEATFRDLINEIVGPLDIAAETVRQEGSWRAA